MRPSGPPDGQVTICHWDEGANAYEALTLPLPALAGHVRHPEDVIPPTPAFPGLEDGQNWPLGEPLWENGCALPQPTPTPTGSLPTTGWDAANLLLLLALALVAVGWLMVRGARA